MNRPLGELHFGRFPLVARSSSGDLQAAVEQRVEPERQIDRALGHVQLSSRIQPRPAR
jgi:hypothetical protein